jgi:hypothetical protein
MVRQARTRPLQNEKQATHWVFSPQFH